MKNTRTDSVFLSHVVWPFCLLVDFSSSSIRLKFCTFSISIANSKHFKQIPFDFITNTKRRLKKNSSKVMNKTVISIWVLEKSMSFCQLWNKKHFFSLKKNIDLFFSFYTEWNWIWGDLGKKRSNVSETIRLLWSL